MKNTSLLSRRNWLRNTTLSSAGLVMAAHTGVFAQSANDYPNEEELVRLFSNENPYGPSRQAKAAIEKLLHRANRYPTYHEVNPQALKEAIAKKEGLKPENVVLGHGSYQLLTLIAILYGNQQQTLVIPRPTFNVTGAYAEKQLGARVKYVNLDTKFGMDLPAMRRAIDNRTSMVMICNPNNPTGTSVSAQKLADFCKEVGKKATVFVDEAYIEYAPPTHTQSMVALVRQQENVLITRTFSKMYGLAGMRVGYALARKDIATKLDALNGRFGQLINGLGLAAAMASLKDERFIKKSVRKNEEVKNWFYQQLRQTGVPYIASDTNFVYVQTGKIYANFHSQLATHHLKAVGHDKSEWSRISIGTLANMKQLMRSMKTMQKI
ncbi:pyridoxal phosphate-dependent aminotransferase [Microscilla marina]|uniref:Histidinol-phosphate aminotransferase 2 n=1 Tax=Microscilla marina ATCC 23134 TaxID=313606 RepID=A1ZHV2_MICM2|nr:histidinol-phosphate transaminase [Microscilla marina]EAY30110.1 histidinol-phosphate aminotransferase 2 [Microscilla marina ATCC 23134]